MGQPLGVQLPLSAPVILHFDYKYRELNGRVADPSTMANVVSRARAPTKPLLCFTAEASPERLVVSIAGSSRETPPFRTSYFAMLRGCGVSAKGGSAFGGEGSSAPGRREGRCDTCRVGVIHS